MKVFKNKILPASLLIILSYVAVSCLAYRFKHPKQTETELMKNIVKALTWS